MGVTFILEGIASLAITEHQWEKATKLLSWVARQREDKAELRPPIEQAAVDQDLAILQEHLSEEALACLTAEGNAMTIEQAVALALEV